MKRLLFSLSIALFAMIAIPTNAQNIIDAEENNETPHFYEKSIAQGKKAIPFEFLRESDVVWETAIWRTIDFREKFNQFFFYPTEKNENTQGRQNLANLIYQAVSNGDIEVFEDDELKVPKEWESLYKELNKVDTITVPGETDEYGDQITPDTEKIVTTEFDAANYKSIYLKEYWYIDKEDSRQKVRLWAMALVENYAKERDGEVTYTPMARFWVPMNDMRVRNILVKVNAYDENNNSLERSYDEIFLSRYFDSYITRETNRHNREIGAYLTGLDAIIESQNIEEKIFNIESDMWEY